MVVLSGLLLGMFLSSMDQTIVSTAMRTIADKLHGQTAQAWVTTAYLITATVTTPLYGKLGDNYGRKRFYLFAVGLFVLGSILCGTATSIYQLAAYRGIQGLGAGGLMSLAFAIIADIVPPGSRARYQSYFMGVFATSSVIGPVIGGALAGQTRLLGTDGWRWIFYLNVPTGVLTLVVAARYLHLPRYRSTERIDLIGSVLLTMSVVPVLLVAEKGREWGWASQRVFGLVALTVVALVGFIVWERRMVDAAILPFRIFRNRVFSLSVTVASLTGFGMLGMMVGLPLYLQLVRGMSPTRTGIEMLPLMAGIILCGQLSGRAMDRTGRYKIFPIMGLSLMLVALIPLSQLRVDTPMWVLIAAMVVMGAGIGLAMQPLVVGVQNALSSADTGVATSSVVFFRSIGSTLGAAAALSLIFGTVVSNIRDRAVTAGLSPDAISRVGKTEFLNDTSGLSRLPKPIHSAVLEGFSASFRLSFLVLGLTLVPAILIATRIPELPVRTPSLSDEQRVTEPALL